MAAYATASDLATYALSPAFLSSIPIADQNNMLLAASAEADSYMAQHFTLPIVAPYPTDLKLNVCKLAAYYLVVRRGYNPDSGADKAIKDRHDESLVWFKAVANGEVTPAVADSSSGAIVGGAFVSTGTQRGFSSRGAIPGTGGPFNGD